MPGYADIGEYWREEFEIPDLESMFDEMYQRVEPLYRLLHAVVRFRLAKLYPDVVHASLPIPAHLLGKVSFVDQENNFSRIVFLNRSSSLQGTYGHKVGKH